jgi:predicted PurR-regulated permease PerM
MSGYVLNLLSGVISLIILLVLVIYTVAQPEPLIAGFLSAVPPRYRDRADSTLRNSMEKLKQWAIGSLIVGVIVGVATGVGLHLLGVPYAFLFGVIAAIGELLPTLGPILSAIPPLLLALAIDPMIALWVLLFFVVLQQVEGNLLTPLVMGGKLDLHPVSIVFAVLVMHSLFGLFGALLAVPVCAIIKVCWEELYLKPAGTDKNALEDEADSIAANESADEAGDSGDEQAANSDAGQATTSEPRDYPRAA